MSEEKESLPSIEEVRENYDFLFREVIEGKKKGYVPIALSFREFVYKNGLLPNPSDLLALDILCYRAFANEETPFEGKEAALEALSLLTKHQKEIDPEEALSAYEMLLASFLELEDPIHAIGCADEASFLSFRLGKKEESLRHIEEQATLAWRFPLKERESKFPNYETLLMMFGKEAAKSIREEYEKGPYTLHDPIESNPLFIKLLPKIEEETREYFAKKKESFNELSYNEKKRELLEKEGFLWVPPYPNPNRLEKA